MFSSIISTALFLFSILLTLHDNGVDTTSILQCYKCTSVRPPSYLNETVRLCADFDYSAKFVVDCPYSTYCWKSLSSAFISQTINLSERGCAQQKYVTQNYTNGKWKPQIIIEEPYQAGCGEQDDKGQRTSKTIDCYCNSWLCNSGPTNNESNLKIAIFVFLTLFVARFRCE